VAALPFADEALARRLEGVANRFMLGWVRALAVRVERFGAASAVACAERPELDFVNRVYGLWPEDERYVGEIVAFYRAARLRPWFELAPGGGFERLAARLTRAGGAQIGFHAVLYGSAEGRGEGSGGVRVERVGAADGLRFAETLLAGHEVPTDARAQDAPRLARNDAPGWQRYLAYLGGEPAAAAVLALDDGIAYLANAATVPAHRGCGCHSALIGRRLADAAEAGCELAVSGARFASQSQRNLERARLRIAYTKAVWRLQNHG
jgi:hypothetical protein